MTGPSNQYVETPNFGFNKPEVGGEADFDTWGRDYAGGDPAVDPSPGLNGNWEKADVLLKAQLDAIVQLETDAAGIPDLIASLQYKVGDLYISLTDSDPATTLGYGTWAVWGAGRALVGVGTADGEAWAVDEEKGAETHTLTSGQLPSHTHWMDPPNTTSSSNGSHNHSYTPAGSTGGGGTSGFGARTKTNSFSAGPNHTHTFDIPSYTSGSTGGGSSHENRQPYHVHKIWERTA